MGLCRPETDVTGMPGWRKTSWGYHGDDGCKFNHPVGIGSKYAEPYAAGDVVGCGLSLQTSQLFFTRNGVNLGKSSMYLICLNGCSFLKLINRYRLRWCLRNAVPGDRIW